MIPTYIAFGVVLMLMAVVAGILCALLQFRYGFWAALLLCCAWVAALAAGFAWILSDNV